MASAAAVPGTNGGQSYGLPGPANPRARDISLTRMSSLGSGNYNGGGGSGVGKETIDFLLIWFDLKS